MSYKLLLELDSDRKVVAGDAAAFSAAVSAGGDMRVGTAFVFNEHIDPDSANDELCEERMDFRVTYAIKPKDGGPVYAAGITNHRAPVNVATDDSAGFHMRHSLSFFCYNQDGFQGVARPYLDVDNPPSSMLAEPELPATSTDGGGGGGGGSGGGGGADVQASSFHDPTNLEAKYPKYHEISAWDAGTNAPSSAFIYDFEYFKFYAAPSRFTELYENDAEGNVVAGDLDALVKAFQSGAELKVAISGLCDDLYQEGDDRLEHEVFVHIGAVYWLSKTRMLMGAANPVVRTKPCIPLQYGTHAWDFGWLMPRTDGLLARWLANPYTLKMEKSQQRKAMRWFAATY